MKHHKPADKMAGFRINSHQWEEFRKLAESEGTNATEALIAYIDQCLLEGHLAPLSPAQIREGLSELESRIDSLRDRLQNY